jgi:hypothetical protein
MGEGGERNSAGLKSSATGCETGCSWLWGLLALATPFGVSQISMLSRPKAVSKRAGRCDQGHWESTASFDTVPRFVRHLLRMLC